MENADFLVIGGGVAGLSAAARLARHGRVLLLEGEEALGYHASGRSATFSHYGIGNRVVRGLTARSRAFFLEHEAGALCRRSPALFVATAEMRSALAALEEEMRAFTDALAPVGEPEMRRLFPPLRTGDDAIVAGLLFEDGLRLDSDAMLQLFARIVRDADGQVLTGRRVERLSHDAGLWTASSGAAAWSAPVVIDAAGAWGDAVAALAGVAPVGLKPLRRTIIVVDPPEGVDVRGWPFVKTAVDDFYILPESGRLMASPVDEVEAEPGDTQPEEYDLALAAWKVERYTTLPVARIANRWAGLRTFAPDRSPVVGFASDAPGFFWLAGQGGFGLQTAPAMAEAVESLITGASWPDVLASAGVTAADLSPDRFRAP